MANSEGSLVACHDCDLLFRKPRLRTGEKLICSRCGALLYCHKPDSVRHALSFSLAALIMFLLANVYPLLDFKLQGQSQLCDLITGVNQLYRQGYWELAILVFIMSILAPFLKIASLLYVLLPLQFNRRPWQLARALRFVEYLHPWAMIEVYLLGMIVAIVKLKDIATIVTGVGLYSFVALILLMAAADSALEMHEVWERVKIRQ
ncbi:MAG TPA: paraquat-inducible protein A [Candidatus Competibacteraceae bacterium]|nr:paraquat-inducible protein A [Candidatus Competibacteraceae bacterium]